MDQTSSTESNSNASESAVTGGEEVNLHDSGSAGVEDADTSGGEAEFYDANDGAEGEESGEENAGANDEAESEDDKALRALVLQRMLPQNQQNQQNQRQGQNQSSGESKPGKLTASLNEGVEKIKAKLENDGYEFGDGLSASLQELLSPITERLDELDHRETSSREAQKAQYESSWNSCLDSLVSGNPAAQKMLGSFANGSANQHARQVLHDMALSFQRANSSLTGPKAFEKAVNFIYGKSAQASGKNMNQSAAGGNTRRVPPPQTKGTQAKPGQVGKDGKPIKKTPADAANAERLSPAEKNRIAGMTKGW